MRITHVVGSLALAALGIVACGASERETASAATSTDGGGPGPSIDPIDRDAQAATSESDEACAKMDIVFVVDNSGSMQEEQSNLANNFSVVTQKLDAFTTKSGAKLDYRIAVTTTGKSARYTIAPKSPFPNIPDPPPMKIDDKGDDGRFRHGCGMTRGWLERGDANIVNQLSCIANVGTNGPSLEMPLESLRLALTDRMSDGANAGFLRDDALLAVVMMTDEDDCSRTDEDFTIADDTCPMGPPSVPLDDYVGALDKLKGGRSRWAGAVIAGPTECSSSFGSAKEAARLKQFVAKSGGNVVFSSICLGNLTSALENAIAAFDAACKKFNVK
jgi:hypothetical protein